MEEKVKKKAEKEKWNEETFRAEISIVWTICFNIHTEGTNLRELCFRYNIPAHFDVNFKR